MKEGRERKTDRGGRKREKNHWEEKWKKRVNRWGRDKQENVLIERNREKWKRIRISDESDGHHEREEGTGE